MRSSSFSYEVDSVPLKSLAAVSSSSSLCAPLLCVYSDPQNVAFFCNRVFTNEISLVRMRLRWVEVDPVLMMDIPIGRGIFR